MRLILLCLLSCLAACATGGPGFVGVDAERVTQDGSTFLFRRNGPLIEAQRVSPEWLPSFQPVARKAGLAAEARTNCAVDWILGDQAMMLLALACPGGPDPPNMPRSKHWRCDALGTATRLTDRLVASDFNLTCRPG